MNATRPALPGIVYKVVQAQPSGLKHADVVRELRRMGYVGGPGFSAEIHEILTDFVTNGEIVRNEFGMERRYCTAPKNRLRVLVVDDNPDYADSSATLLQHAGHEVRAVYSGHDALEAVNEDWSPNLVLLDIGMPVMDGYATARNLRKKKADLTLVALTGHEDRRASKEAGFDYHVNKPVENEDLVQVVEAPDSRFSLREEFV